MSLLVDEYNQRVDGLAVLRGLIDLLANPEATRELLDKLAEAHAKADEERAAVKQLRPSRNKSARRWPTKPKRITVLCRTSACSSMMKSISGKTNLRKRKPR